jgi:hypothetical protein
VYATANGFVNMALNRDKVAEFAKGSRVMYKGWLHGYGRAAALTGSKLVTMASHGAKSTLGPSLVYGVTMQVATTALGLPSLVAVGGANVATPVIVSKLSGSLGKLSTASHAARALPIAVHCVIEWGLYAKLKEHFVTRNIHLGRGAGVVPRTRMSLVLEGALVGGVCAAAATATTVVALSPWYGGKLLSRAFMADSTAAAAKLSMAAVRLTGIRLADSLQQGVVWFSTYEGMRAAMAIYDKKAAEVAVVEEQKEAATIPSRLSVSAANALDGQVSPPLSPRFSRKSSSSRLSVSVADTLEGQVSPPMSPRFSRKSSSSRLSVSVADTLEGQVSPPMSPRFSRKSSSSPRVSMSRTYSSSDFQAPRRFSLAGC